MINIFGRCITIFKFNIQCCSDFIIFLNTYFYHFVGIIYEIIYEFTCPHMMLIDSLIIGLNTYIKKGVVKKFPCGIRLTTSTGGGQNLKFCGMYIFSQIFHAENFLGVRNVKNFVDENFAP